MCNRLGLINQQKPAGMDTNRYDDEIVYITDKLLDHKCVTPTQYKKN